MSEEIGVEVASSTPVERNKFFSICSTPGVEQLYSKILLRNGVERSSGVGVDPYTQYKTVPNKRAHPNKRAPCKIF